MKTLRALVLTIVVGGLAFAQQPNIQNAKLETRSAAGGLQAQVDTIARQGGASWIAWLVPSVKGENNMCCYNNYGDSNYNCGCALETNGPANVGGTQSTSVKLEGSSEFVVFVRAEGGQIQKVRALGANCPVDAQNMPVYWLTGVKPSDSVALLVALAEKTGSDGEKKPADGAVLSIALTNDPAADAALDKLIAPDKPEWLRKKVAFWMGVERGSRGLDKLLALMKSDQSSSFRHELVFPISQSRDPRAETELIRIAKEDQSTKVREQAIFWMAQKAGKKAASFLKDTVDNDPDTDLKKRAVFALSQMPKDEGIPLLIQVAKTNASPAVRKQAIFWLGQSHDTRALDYIESVLKQ
jgi:HEAT repeats/PBS lyase HEAT-like repeat